MHCHFDVNIHFQTSILLWIHLQCQQDNDVDDGGRKSGRYNWSERTCVGSPTLVCMCVSAWLTEFVFVYVGKIENVFKFWLVDSSFVSLHNSSHSASIITSNWCHLDQFYALITVVRSDFSARMLKLYRLSIELNAGQSKMSKNCKRRRENGKM